MNRKSSYYRSRSERLKNLFQSLFWDMGGFSPRRSRSFHPRMFLFLVVALVTVGALGCQIIWQQVKVAQVRYQIDQLQKKNHKLRMAVHKNEVIVSRLERLDRIEYLARSELGMKPSDTVPVLTFRSAQWAKLPQDGERSRK